MASEEIDLNLPAATVLRLGSAKVHQQIEHSSGATALLGGNLDREEYVRLLMMLWYVYSALEHGLSKHATHTVLTHIYNPSLLSRTSRLSTDISFLLGLPDDDISWKSHLVHVLLIESPPDALRLYTSHLAALSSDNPALLLAHSYVRYLGDLSGGQIMKWKLQKVYGLQGDKKGFEFYDFEVDGETASVAEMKMIKQWFKDGIDKGVGEDQEMKGALLEETRKAFEMNSEIFSALRARRSVWGPPSAELEEKKPKTNYPVTSMITLVFAVVLAHFILAVTGLIGGSGFARLALPQKLSAGLIHA